MSPQPVRVAGTELALFRVEGDSPPGRPELVWAHGWGHSHREMLPLAEAMRRSAPSVLLDLPGFGASPVPPGAWDTADYADMVAAWLAGLPRARRIWVGHSFGCRVGLQLAARHPQLIDGLFLLAAAGLRRQRTGLQHLRFKLRGYAFRIARGLAPEGPARDRLRRRFGSADYLQAGPMRPVLVKAVTEDLTDVAAAIRCPVTLIYGDRDTETPPELGHRFNALIPGSRLVLLRGFDHWTVLTEGRHQVTQRLTEFLEQFA